MPDIARALREEITRLARKESKAHTRPLVQQVRDLRRQVREQKQQIEGLNKALAKKADRPAQIAPDGAEDGAAIRIRAGSARKHRERLGLSQREMALLLDVSALTIGNWESGKAAPRGQNRVAFGKLRQMGVREVRARLEELSGG